MSASQRYEQMAQSWRRRVLGPILAVCAVLVVGFTIAGNLLHGPAKFWFGVLAGATMALYVAARESPPGRIANWRLGSEGERRTEGALRALEGERWWIRHDLDGGRGNIDHVVVGDAGVFLLDSKNYSGEARVEDGELRCRSFDDPNDEWTCEGLAGRMAGAAADLKDRIEAATGIRLWVRSAVVMWGRFPQRCAPLGKGFVVHGSDLVAWLRAQAPSRRPFDQQKVRAFLDSLPSAALAHR
jgi:hypothetical protein